MDSISKFPLRIFAAWIAAIFMYLYFLNPQEIYQYPIENVGNPVEAIVYIAMGSMKDDAMVDYSIASVRSLGKWRGEIYILTDAPECFLKATHDYEAIIVTVPTQKSIIEIKALKTKLLNYVPNKVNSILYIDVDVVVTKSLIPFISDLAYSLNQKNKKSMQNTNNTNDSFDFGAFLDAKGHYVGWCAGCEKWHTGVMWMRRGYGNKCLKTWESILLSGKYNTDQQSLDSAEQNGSCSHSISFPTRHLLFAKDYIGMFLTSGQTFIHLTAAGRASEQDFFYRDYIIPMIRNSLHPPLNPNILKHRKVC
jgi:hypothetical protein